MRPCLNPDQLIVGQLTGGDAACGNNLPDWFGRFYSSWIGGGSKSVRLSHWLDSRDTGISRLIGAENGVDAYMRDKAKDDGEFPSKTTYYYQFPDIWVRQV